MTRKKTCYINQSCGSGERMYATQYFDELRSIAARMDRLLPPPQQEQTSPVPKAARYAVIEAKAIDVIQVQHQSSAWLFQQDVPPLHQGQESRRAFVESKTLLSTFIQEEEQGKESESARKATGLPSGISLWHATDSARRTLLLARRDLDLFFSTDPEHTLPYEKDMGVFALPEGKELCFKDCMTLIQGQAPYLYKICWEYALLAAHIYGISVTDFGVISRVLVQRIQSHTGKPSRLLHTRQARYDGGPVLMISLGLPRTAHDVSPTLMQPDQGKEHPTRIFVPEGVMMVIDGDARFRYSHGLPKGQEGGSVFYTITISMDCVGQTSISGYERETRTLIMTTPMRMENIITIRPASPFQSNVHTTLQRDTLWKLVQTMRTRLRAAESHLIMQKYRQRAKEDFMSSTEVSKR